MWWWRFACPCLGGEIRLLLELGASDGDALFDLGFGEAVVFELDAVFDELDLDLATLVVGDDVGVGLATGGAGGVLGAVRGAVAVADVELTCLRAKGGWKVGWE